MPAPPPPAAHSLQKRELPVPGPRFNFARSLGAQRSGKFDPTATLGPLNLTKAYHGLHGVVLARAIHEEDVIRLEVDGPGAAEEVNRWETLWPPADRYAEFAPEDRTVLRLHRSLPGLRLLRHPWLFDVACRSILQQRVTWQEALSAWRKLVNTLGDEYGELRAFPAPARLGRTDPRSLRVFDIDLKRAQAIVALARAELAEPFLGTSTPHAVLRERLRAIPGIGVWTTEKILGSGAGDPDAVPTGDLHLPNTVSWALAGEARGSDERMVELLEPYRGHRYRVLSLLSAGKLKAPTFGPKKPRRPPR